MSGVVHVVDDDVSYRTAIQRRLAMAGYEVAVYASANQLLDCLPATDEPGCILLDVQMPGVSGPELQSGLIARGVGIPIIFVSGHVDTATIVQAIKLGAEDFLTKPVTSQQLIEAIERAFLRQQAACERGRQLALLRARVTSLTPREREVFDLMVRGRINKQIAYELGTAERTIKAHRHQVMEKMQVISFAELVSIAERLGMRA
jgi:FixJ family two-component response regulator